MPWRASSTASARVKPSTAALVVSYWPMPARPSTPKTDETLTMVPSAAARRRASAAFAQNAVASTLTSTMRRQSSAVASASVAYTRMPATLTSACSAPKRATAVSTARRASASSATSAPTSTSTTAPSSSAKSRAVASPMPPPPPVTRATRPLMRPGIAGSGEAERLSGAHEDERLRGRQPVVVRPQDQRGGAHTERSGIAARGRLAAIAQRAGGAHQPPANLDDGGIARSEALLRAVDDGPLALLDRLVLHTEAGDAAEHRRPMRLPVHEVVVVAVGRRADVPVGLRRLGRIVADVRPLARDVQRDLVGGERPLGVPGDHPVHHVRVVHRHPDVRLDDLLADADGRHGVERQQELRHAPEPATVRLRAPRADDGAVIRVHHLEARRAITGLDGGADAEADAVHVVRDLAVGVVERRVQERDVAGVDAALERLKPVAVLDTPRHEHVVRRQHRPLERGQRRRPPGSHEGPYDTAALLARICDVAHLRGKARLRRLARHLDTLAVERELPAVIHTPDTALFVAGKIQRRRAMRTELGDESDATGRRAVDDEALAQELHALDAPAGCQIARADHGNPVAAQEVAHRRSRAGPSQELVVRRAEHRRDPPAISKVSCSRA